MIPFHLITGFLGSGKTTFLKELLAQHSHSQKIAVIQNEFAETGIDGKELQQTQWKFDLLEVNKGSVFCICLFSDFRLQLKRFIDECQPDRVILEATGLADPIAIGELLMDKELQQRVYLANIWTIVDAQHYEKVRFMTAVKNQLLIADDVVINKCDLAGKAECQQIISDIATINPLARIVKTSFCKLPLQVFPQPNRIFSQSFEPSIAPQGIRTQVYRTPHTVKKRNLDFMIKQLNSENIRLKGYIRLEDNKVCMIQCVFGQTILIPVSESITSTEIISIGTKTMDFEMILRKMILI